MTYFYRTCTPNQLFDKHLYLKEVELKILLVVIRQTYGYYDKKKGRSKEWDWLSISFFVKKTSKSRKSISLAIQQLINKKLILVKNERGVLVHTPELRRLSKKLYFKATLEQFFCRANVGNYMKILFLSEESSHYILLQIYIVL